MNMQIEMGKKLLQHIGRGLLGLYFIIPGVFKITGWSGTVEYMAAHNVPLITLLLVITIFIQIGGGVSLLIGYRAQLMAFLLAVLTLSISVFMHDFWNMKQGMERAHEMQNFIKNLAIMAGLMYVAGVTVKKETK